jgi:mannose-6-phosphate isomerase-like protein (cupin superfamily)
VFDKEPVHVQNPRTFIFLGVTMTIHLSGTETGGKFSLIEDTTPPGGDGGLQIHSREDEAIYLLSGALDVSIGDRAFTQTPGQSYFPHRLRNADARPARALLMNTPGTSDEFVCRAGIPAGQEPVHPTFPDKSQIQTLPSLATEFGVTILAPPEPPLRS